MQLVGEDEHAGMPETFDQGQQNEQWGNSWDQQGGGGGADGGWDQQSQMQGGEHWDSMSGGQPDQVSAYFPADEALQQGMAQAQFSEW